MSQLGSKRDWVQIAKDLKPVYTAASESEALDRFAEFSGKWEKRYPAIIRLWENARAEFVPFLRFDREIRTVICTTNAIESINVRLRRAVNARGHFPTEQAALKCRHLALRSLDPTGKGRKRFQPRALDHDCDAQAGASGLSINPDGAASSTAAVPFTGLRATPARTTASRPGIGPAGPWGCYALASTRPGPYTSRPSKKARNVHAEWL